MGGDVLRGEALLGHVQPGRKWTLWSEHLVALSIMGNLPNPEFPAVELPWRLLLLWVCLGRADQQMFALSLKEFAGCLRLSLGSRNIASGSPRRRDDSRLYLALVTNLTTQR